MEDSDHLIRELETHVQRILEYYDPTHPYAQVMNVSGKRGDLISALARYIDGRVEHRIAQFARDVIAAADTLPTARSDWPHSK